MSTKRSLPFVLTLIVLSNQTCKKYDFMNPTDPAYSLKKPSNLVAGVTSDTIVTLAWDDTNFDPVYSSVPGFFVIEQSTDSINFSAIKRADKSTRTGTVTGLFDPSQSYFFRVYAQVGLKNSEASNIASIRLDTFDMVFVQGGTFQMGDGANVDTRPVHTVTLNDFYIDRYEVTVLQYGLFARATGHSVPAIFPNDSLPMAFVDWSDAVDYAQWMGKRLPTEAEWEYAARGGSRSRGYLFSGSNDADSVAWNAGNSGNKPHPVGQKKSNELGISDMSGNVWEWCKDWHAAYNAAPQTNPQGPDSGTTRIMRGGSFAPVDSVRWCSVAWRGANVPSLRAGSVGFRCVKDRVR